MLYNLRPFKQGVENMKPYIVFVLFLVILNFPGMSRAETHRFTLDQAVTAGLEANPGVDSARQVLAQSRLMIKAARGYFLPSVNLQSSFSNYSQKGDILSVDQLDRNIFTNEVKISQTLFAGFALLSNYAKSKIQADMDTARLNQAKLDLIYHIQQNFLYLLKTRQDFNTIADQIERLKSQLAASKVFYKSGFNPHTEVLKSEVALAKAQADKVKIQNRIKNYTTQLNTYLAMPFDEDIAYEGNLHAFNSDIGYDLGSAVRTALLKRPDLTIGEKSLDIAEKEAKGTLAKYYPRVTLDYSKTKQHNDYTTDYTYSTSKQDVDSIGINLSWNIFDGGTTTYSHLGELRHITALKKALQDKTAQAKAAIVQAFTDLDDAKKLIELSLEEKKSALENYNMAAARYKTRIGSLSDLLDAQYDLSQSEFDISNAYMQYQIARASLFYNIGVENFGLN